MKRARRTYGAFVELAKALDNLCDDGCPSCDIFGLRVRTELGVVLKDAKTEPTVADLLTGLQPKKWVTYGSNRSATWGRAAWCAGRGSKYISERICTSVAALLDSCLSRFGRCFINPSPAH